MVTFVYGTYFSQAIAPDEITGTALWSRSIVVTGLVVALVSPVLGAIADRSGARSRYLLVSFFIGQDIFIRYSMLDVRCSKFISLFFD